MASYLRLSYLLTVAHSQTSIERSDDAFLIVGAGDKLSAALLSSTASTQKLEIGMWQPQTRMRTSQG